MRRIALAIALVTGGAQTSLLAVAPKAASLDSLLEKVKKDQVLESKENKDREARFLQEKNKQAELLALAKKQLEQETARGEKLKIKFEENEKVLAGLEEKLRLTMGTLGELFGVVKQVAGDTKGVLENSIVSAQLPDRISFVDQLGRRKKLPNTQELRQLWFTLLQEMTESGKVSRFETAVTSVHGEETKQEVIRVGAFNLISKGEYLQYLPQVGKVAELGRQPQGRYLSMAEDFAESKEAMAPFGLDPSRGTILSLLVQAPSLKERVEQGGLVGYVIIGVLLIGLGITLERIIRLSRVGALVKRQLASSSIDPENPLGKILHIYEANKGRDLESLELKLDEAILKETGKLDRGISTIKILAAVAPLLGLLGTVTGMIGTFQAITLFGTGDPKLMAGGISQALVTTVLGLVAAIPLIVLHSLVSGKSKGITQVLEEQSIGLIAEKAEAEGHAP